MRRRKLNGGGINGLTIHHLTGNFSLCRHCIGSARRDILFPSELWLRAFAGGWRNHFAVS